jgi:hypothetical protein
MNSIKINPKADSVIEIRRALQQLDKDLNAVSASEIPSSPYGSIYATNVQDALEELDDEKELVGSTATHESTYDHTKLHNRKHAIDSSLDHDDIVAVDGSLVHISGNALKPSNIELNDLLLLSGTIPFSFFVAETSGGSPTKMISIINNRIVF